MITLRGCCRNLLLLGLCVVGATSPGSASSDAALDTLVDRIQARYDRLESLQAEFVQQLDSVALGAPQEESGSLFLRRPGRMRWEYREPEEKLAVVDGRQTWLYVPAENQVILGTLEEVQNSGAAGLLLAGKVDLRRDYEIELLEDAVAQASDAEDAVVRLRLVPRRPSEDFAALELTVALEDLLPVRIVVRGHLGDVMQYHLRNVRTGMPLDDALFRFEPPPGVDLVLSE